MSDLLKYINKQEEQSGLLNLNSQNKLIVFGSLISSVLIVTTAWIVINNTQKTIVESYHNFGSMLAKTLATEGATLIDEASDSKRFVKIQEHTVQVTNGSEDIAYVVYRDKKGEIIYSNKPNMLLEKPNIEVGQPLVLIKNSKKHVIGSIQLGLTGYTMNIVGKATRNLMIVVFTIAWILSIAAVFINTILITRQIKLLAEGVRRISTGEFGYKIKSKDLWGDIKQLFESFNNMSVKLRKYEEKNIDQLTYERNKLEAVLMSIANGVIVCDNTDSVIISNNAALEMIGVKARDFISTKITDFYDANGELCFVSKIKQFKDTPYEGTRANNLECQIQIDNKILKTIISPLFTLHDEYLGYVLVLLDVTKESEIDRMKNTFISNVSHELRTPVTVLRSYIDTLYNYDNELDEDTRKEFISILNQESDRLNKMVNDILDFSRLESPNIKLEKTCCDIGPIIELTVSSMKVLAQEKDISFSIIIEPDLPQVSINPESIERVMKNLISNAIKYSYNNGRIKLRAEIDRTGKYLQVSVEDNGHGIPEEHLPKIFDRFYRVENKVHSVKGTGLGLHLVKISIEKHHNGKVFVESQSEEGSTFGFKIPLTEEEIEESQDSLSENKLTEF